MLNLSPTRLTQLSLVWLCASHTTPAWAEADVHGVVLLNQAGGTPMVGVSISAEGVQTVSTNSSGQFHLKFSNLKPGREVRINVTHKGYSAVNKDQLERPLPDAAAKPLLIILCKSDEWDSWASRYYRIDPRLAIRPTSEARRTQP